MGSLKHAWRAALGALVVLVPNCSEERSLPNCVTFCEDLAACALLPSPLGIGSTAEERRQNCVDRCSVADQPAVNLTACDKEAHPKGASKPTWCNDGCSGLAACVTSHYPSGEATGTGQVVVQLRIDSSSSGIDDGCGTADARSRGVPDPMLCDQVGLGRVMLIAPGITASTAAQFDKPCKDAMTASFPPVTTHAGQFVASLKLIGSLPAPGEAGGAAGEAGQAGAPAQAPAGGGEGGMGGERDAGTGGLSPMKNGSGGSGTESAPPTVCRVMSLGQRNAVAGSPTPIYAVVPGDWATNAKLGPCESNCFDGIDDDHDGRLDCDDPACAQTCQACSRITKDGKLVPDCSDPDCGCVTSAGTGGMSGAPAAGTGGASGAPATGGSGAGGAATGGATTGGLGGDSYGGALGGAGAAGTSASGGGGAAGDAGGGEGGHGGQGG